MHLFPDLRPKIANNQTLQEIINDVQELKKRLLVLSNNQKEGPLDYVPPLDEQGYRDLPIWVAQPYIRTLKKALKETDEQKENNIENKVTYEPFICQRKEKRKLTKEEREANILKKSKL